MKKIRNIIALLLIASVFMSMQNVFAFQLLNPTGPTMSADDSMNWIATLSTEARVQRILEGNYAFVADRNKAWNKTEVYTATKSPYMNEDYEFFIPTEMANAMLGTSYKQEYIQLSQLASDTNLNTFSDPRGLCILSRSSAPVMLKYNPNNDGYYDFYTVVDAIGYILWEDIHPTDEDYEEYIRRWQQAITVPDGKKEEYKDYVNSALKAGKTTQEMMHLGENGDGPFEGISLKDLPLDTAPISQQFQAAYTNLLKMAKRYYLLEEKDEKLKKDIFDCLEWLYGHYSKQLQYKVQTGSSWPGYAFNTPYLYGNILCLMYDELTQEDLVRHTNAIFDRVPDSTSTRGGYAASWNVVNRSWVSFAYLNNAILARDEYRINHALKYMTEGYIYSIPEYQALDMPAGGILKDGSVIFHKTIPYTTGYGMTHITNISDALILGANSVFSFQNIPFYENIYDMIITNYLPFYIDNTKAKAVSGRWDPDSGKATIIPVMVLANHADSQNRLKLTKEILRVIDGYEDSYQKASSGNRASEYPAYQEELDKFWEYAKNISAAEKEDVIDKVYASMDRTLHIEKDHTVLISMSSERTEKYEAMVGGVGGTDWYVNDGALYVYNRDNKQFNTQWFTGTNKYMIPGTTVDSTPRNETFITGTKAANWGMPDNDWAGGTSDGKNSVTSMVMGNKHVSGLAGKKAYFLLNGQIVALGTGITGGQGEVKTVIDNRYADKESDGDVNNEYEIMPVAARAEDESLNATMPNAIDKDLSSGVAHEILDGWFEFEFDDVYSFEGFAIAFNKGTQRKTSFIVSVSQDGKEYKDVGTFTSNGKTNNYEFYAAPCKAKYVRLINLGNTSSNWFFVNEFTAFKSGANKEEIVESFDVPVLGYERISVDGTEVEEKFSTELSFAGAKSAHLEGFGGYAVLDDHDLYINRETINGKVFNQFYFKHGENPSGESYAYAMLPGMTEEETMAYAASPTIEIIENSTTCQGIKELESGLVGLSAYGQYVYGDLKINTPCNLLINESEQEIWVADPTLKSGLIELELPENYIVKNSKFVTRDGNKIYVNVSVERGGVCVEYEKADADDGSISVNDYRIKMKGNYIVTKLLTGAAGNFTFNITNDLNNGRAYIKGDTLYYYANTGFTGTETIKITATDETNKCSFKVYIDKE